MVRFLLLMVALALLAAPSPSHSWLMQASHTSVQVNTTHNVTVACVYDGNHHGQLPMQSVLLISITRSKGNQILTTFKVRVDADKPAISPENGDQHPGMTVKGYAGKVTDSFLSVTWSTATPETAGEYSCLIEGFTQLDTIVEVDTNRVAIEAADTPLSVNELYDKLVRDFTKRLDEVEKTFKSELNNLTRRIDEPLNEELERMKMEIKSGFSDLADRIHELQSREHDNQGCDCNTTTVDDDLSRRTKEWPSGRYAFPQTTHGCPSGLNSYWSSGFIRFHSESSSRHDINNTNQDAVSVNIHLATPIFSTEKGHNFFTLRTCSLGKISTGPNWPRGSYCIHRYGGWCPVGFRTGGIGFENENEPAVGSYSTASNPPDYRDHYYIRTLWFCCRGDGDPDVPITLPVDKPIMLYRYKGQCQQIHKAHVQEEWMTVDTDDDDNKDRYEAMTHPDATLNPVHVVLCYYSPIA